MGRCPRGLVKKVIFFLTNRCLSIHRRKINAKVASELPKLRQGWTRCGIKRPLKLEEIRIIAYFCRADKSRPQTYAQFSDSCRHPAGKNKKRINLLPGKAPTLTSPSLLPRLCVPNKLACCALKKNARAFLFSEKCTRQRFFPSKKWGAYFAITNHDFLFFPQDGKEVYRFVKLTNFNSHERPLHSIL